jgi:cold-inducible RNA-binding protein
MGTNKLFLGNLAWDVKEDDLRGLFKEHDVSCDEVKLIHDRDTGRSRGFAFATFGSVAAAEDARRKLDGVELVGRTLHVDEASDKPKGRGGGGREKRGRGDRQRGRREEW